MKINLLKKTLLVFMLIAVISCQTKKAEETRLSKVEESPSKVILWEMVKDDAVIYIAGSVHVGTEDMYPLDSRYYKALEKSDFIITEMDLSEESTAVIQGLTLTEGVYEEGDSILNYLDQDYAQTLEKEILAPIGISINDFSSFKPWVLSTTIGLIGLQLAGYTADLGIDLHFVNKGIELNKEFMYFEEPEEQFQIISGGSQEEQLLDLYSVIDDYKLIPDFGDKIISAYIQGDLKALEEVLLETFNEPGMEEYRERLLINRNYNWADSLEHLARNSTKCFVVVGSAHLVGEESLIDILETRGYKLVRQ